MTDTDREALRLAEKGLHIHHPASAEYIICEALIQCSGALAAERRAAALAHARAQPQGERVIVWRHTEEQVRVYSVDRLWRQSDAVRNRPYEGYEYAWAAIERISAGKEGNDE
jgi:hypothetical protein